ncbi:hypothetical protein LZC95_47200 [Pendulispora brunnea]|uniref:Uncharacterized protein n=1 Tax=Pendulispora brunnea TaxID=2905690 RepID=A0ABZ2K9K8_9BACT
MTPHEFEEISLVIDVIRSETKAPEGCFANAIRRYVQGLNWPPTFYANPAYRAELRVLLRALQLKPREREDIVAQGVALLELISSPHADARITWRQAFTGEAGGGGLYPPSAPEGNQDEYNRREKILSHRWATHHLLTHGRDASESSIDVFLQTEFAQALTDRVEAFYGKPRPKDGSIDEHEPIFAEHRHWALKPSFRLTSLISLAWEESWHFNSVTPKHDSRPGEFTWTPLDEATTIRYCESAIIKARYVYATGRDAAAVFERLRGLDVFQPSELVALARAEADPAARRLHVLKMGLSATPRGVLVRENRAPEPDVLAFLADTMGAAEPELRDAAVTAANFLKWDMLALAMEAIVEGDDVAELRTLAARTLREIRRYAHSSEG